MPPLAPLPLPLLLLLLVLVLVDGCGVVLCALDGAAELAAAAGLLAGLAGWLA